jgi:hypothetical protein
LTVDYQFRHRVTYWQWRLCHRPIRHQFQ